jgi:hypothetical protein
MCLCIGIFPDFHALALTSLAKYFANGGQTREHLVLFAEDSAETKTFETENFFDV